MANSSVPISQVVDESGAFSVTRHRNSRGSYELVGQAMYLRLEHPSRELLRAISRALNAALAKERGEDGK